VGCSPPEPRHSRARRRRHADGDRRCAAGLGAEAGRRAADAAPRQPGQHVDPRGVDDCGAGPERKLAEDAARPSIFFPVSGACRQPYFKGHTMMVNGNYNGWRLEDAWLDK
jgi:hypothetical protein